MKKKELQSFKVQQKKKKNSSPNLPENKVHKANMLSYFCKALLLIPMKSNH